VVDARPAGVDGPVLCRRIHRQWPWIQVIVVTEEPDAGQAPPAGEAEDFCFLPGQPLNGSVGATVRSLVEQRTESPAWDGAASGLRAYPDRALSPREKVVWRALQEGLADAQIAERLGVNELTARFHVENVLEKQGLATRRDLGLVEAATR
jgi:DNA-binding NarL/FixJ family response regulator